MSSKKLSSKDLDLILNETIHKVSKSKSEIFEIGEQSRQEYARVVKKLNNVKTEVAQIITEGDLLEKQTRQSRMRLAQVSKHFYKYHEEEIRQVYETANQLQVKLSVLRQRELQLRERRDELERRLVSIKDTIKKAENLTGQISIALNYLSGDLKKVGDLVETANRRQALGLRIIEAQEEERRRLSREIHDGPAQMLANMLLRSELIDKKLEKKGTEAAFAEFRELRGLVKHSLQEVRRIIYDLRPMALDDLGLIPTLSKYLKTIEETFKTRIEFRIIGTKRRLSSKLEVAVFRLVQEGVQNACKHANANGIEVKIEFLQDMISLLIKDDGQGFDIDERKENAFGLIGMYERVDILDGKFILDTAAGKGTIIFIQIPSTKQEVKNEVHT